ncbi:MAG: hypothetical protein EOM21_15815 [Gammaproteobacteria bacterium]|nr:hypothetical protein [Gammaproteobacteria bacterium]
MTIFLRLLGEEDKAGALLDLCGRQRAEGSDPRLFEVAPEAFDAVPGKPFAYWVSEAVRETFRRFPTFENGPRTCRMGMATANDFRFVRAWWEVSESSISSYWFPMAKGGSFSPFYSDITLSVKWTTDDQQGKELKAFAETTPGTTHWSRNLRNVDFYFKAGLTWPLRTHRFCPQALPANSIISVRGSGIYAKELDVLLAFMSSSASDYLMKMVSGRDAHPQFDGGDISLLPLPEFPSSVQVRLSLLARRAWSLKRQLDTANPTSHAFTLPALLQVKGNTLAERTAAWELRVAEIQEELAEIQRQIDDICFDLYGFSEADRAAALAADRAEEPLGDENEGDEAA